MGRLELRFDKPQLGAELSLGVVARVCQIKDADGKFPADAEDREVVIPAGGQARPTLVEVPPGTYRIEARPPSGEVLREVRTVTDDPQSVEVVFRPDQSPHEWLSWQRFAGNVPSQKEYEDWITQLAEGIVRAARAKEDAARPIEIDKTAIQRLATQIRELHVKIQPALRFFGALFTTRPAEFELVHADPPATETLWDAVASLTAWRAWRRTAPPHAGCTATRTDDRQLTLWRIEQVDRAGRPSTASAGTPIPGRWLAVVRRGEGVEVITLPVPWPLDPSRPAAGIEILRESGTAESGRTTITVLDEVLGSLLMYLNNGHMADAATVLVEAARSGVVEELISAKSNPLAACAAAYVGIATLSGAEEPRWAPWLQNLRTWFAWLPDGAIVHAAYLMRTAKTREELDQALAALKEAYRRGLPFYTAGLQHLMNGLYTFSAKDAQALAMHDKVRAVASRVDPNQAFTVITIPAPPS